MVKIKNKKIIILLSFLLLLIIINVLLINSKEILLIDKIGYNLFVKNLRSNSMTKFMKYITKLSNYKMVIILTSFFMIYLYIFFKKVNISIVLMTNNLLNVIINTIIKFIVRRPRPSYKLINITGYSFPSGHAMVTFAFYGLLAYFVYKYVNNKIIKYLLLTILIILTILIGISRVYLGVHYLSDVISGYLISTIYLTVFIKYIEKYKLIP